MEQRDAVDIALPVQTAKSKQNQFYEWGIREFREVVTEIPHAEKVYKARSEVVCKTSRAINFSSQTT